MHCAIVKVWSNLAGYLTWHTMQWFLSLCMCKWGQTLLLHYFLQLDGSSTTRLEQGGKTKFRSNEVEWNPYQLNSMGISYPVVFSARAFPNFISCNTYNNYKSEEAEVKSTCMSLFPSTYFCRSGFEIWNSTVKLVFISFLSSWPTPFPSFCLPFTYVQVNVSKTLVSVNLYWVV